MRRTVLLLSAISLLTFFAGLGRPAVTDSDEAFYAEASREMVETGDWLTPHYNYAPRFQKPILYYWLTAATFVVAGASEFASRFWSATAGLGLVLVTAAAAFRWYGRHAAEAAGLIAATSFGYFAVARMALPDLPLAFFVTLAIWTAMVGLFESREAGFAVDGAAGGARLNTDARPLGWLLVSAAAAGLAFLTKGPIGVVIPAVVLAPLAAIEWQRFRLRPAHALAAAAVFLAVAAPWYVEMWRVHGADYYRSFFIGDNLERFATTRYNEPRGFWFYGPVIVAGLLPWSPFLLLLVPPAIRAIRRRRFAVLTIRLLTWFVPPFIVFTMSVGKQPRYVLPLLPPLAILIARELSARVEGAAGETRAGRLVSVAATLSGLTLAAIGVVLFRLRPLLVDVPPAFPWVASAAIIAAGIAVAAGAWWSKARIVPITVAAASVVALLSTQYVVLSAPGPEPVERVAAAVRSELPRASGWMTWGDSLFVRNLVFYVGRKQSGPYPFEALGDVLRSSGTMVVVMREGDLSRIEREEGIEVRRVAEVRYFNTASLTPRRLLWPDPSRDLSRVVVAVTSP